MWAFAIAWRPPSIRRPSVHNSNILFSSLTLLGQFWQNFGGIVLGWPPFRIVSDILIGHRIWPPLLKIEQIGVGVLKKLLVRNCWANCNHTVVVWSLNGLLQKLYPELPPTNQMAATIELILTLDLMENSLKNLLVWNCWPNWNQILKEWSPVVPLSEFFPGFHSRTYFNLGPYGKFT